MNLDELFRRYAATRDPVLLGRVFDAAAPRLLRLAIHLVGDAQRAEDLVQATFLGAMEGAASYDPERPVEPWLAGILERQARYAHRRRSRAVDPERLEPRLAATPLEEAMEAELSGALAEALDRLEEPYREALVLRLRHGLAPADIAHAMGEAPGTMRMRLSRGLRKLRALLPAGFATGALLHLVPTPRLAAVRETVLARAAEHAATTSVGAGTAAAVGLRGALVKKGTWLAVGSGVVLTGLASFLVERNGRTQAEDRKAVAASRPGPAWQERNAAKEPPPALERSAPNRTAVTAEVEEARPGGESPGSRATPGGTTRVLVLDAIERPVPGAHVRLEHEGSVHQGLTDADGTLAFPVPLGTDAPRVEVDAEGLFHVRAFMIPRDPITIRLKALTELRGRVLDAETRAPVAGARVRFFHPTCKAECELSTATSGPDGTYRLEAVPLGFRVPFVASAEGYLTSVDSRELQAGTGPPTLDLLLEQGTLVRGTVEDLVTSEPLGGVVVRESENSWEHVETDDQGAFTGRFAFREGKADLRIRHPGRCELGLDVSRQEAEAGPVRIRLVRSVRIRGRITTPAGRPVPDARVFVRDDAARRWGERAAGRERPTPLTDLPAPWRVGDEETHTYAMTDADGRFETATGIRPWDESYVIWVTAAGFEEVKERLPGTGEPGGLLTRDLVLSPAGASGTLVGRATLNGEPLAGSVTYRSSAGRREAPVDAEGRFRISGVWEGPAGLWLESPRIERWLSGGHHVALEVEFDEAYEARQDIELELELTSVAGTAVWSDGTPAAGVGIRARGDRDDWEVNAWGTSTVLEDGTFEVELPVPAGAVSVSADIGTGYGEVEVAPGTSDVRFVLDRPGELLLRVVDAETGQLVPDVQASLARDGKRPDPLPFFLEAPDQGGWMRASVAPGVYDLVAFSEFTGHGLLRVPGLVVRSGAETRQECGLTRGLTATFLLEEGARRLPPNMYWVLLEEHAMGTVRFVPVPAGNGGSVEGGPLFPGMSLSKRALYFDETGRAEVHGLAPGRYGFYTVPALRIEPAWIDLQPDSTGSILLRWSRE